MKLARCGVGRSGLHPQMRVCATACDRPSVAGSAHPQTERQSVRLRGLELTSSTRRPGATLEPHHVSPGFTLRAILQFTPSRLTCPQDRGRAGGPQPLHSRLCHSRCRRHCSALWFRVRLQSPAAAAAVAGQGHHVRRLRLPPAHGSPRQ